MALTNAERQAAHKARRAETLEVLTQQNAALLKENAALRAELDALKEKAHRAEVAALKAQLKAAAGATLRAGGAAAPSVLTPAPAKRQDRLVKKESTGLRQK